MKNKMAVYMLALVLSAPAGVLWAAAGDSTLQGAAGSTSGSPASTTKTPKKHHGRHHKKAMTSEKPSETPAVK